MPGALRGATYLVTQVRGRRGEQSALDAMNVQEAGGYTEPGTGAATPPYVLVCADEGVALPARPEIDFTGPLVSATDGGDRVIVNVTATGQVTVIIDGGGSPITTGVKLDVPLPFSGQFTEWDLVADQSGSIQLDLWRDSYANFPPTVADTITGTDKPRIASGVKNQSVSLTGWTKPFSAGDVLRINVDSASVISRAVLGLRYVRT